MLYVLGDLLRAEQVLSGLPGQTDISLSLMGGVLAGGRSTRLVSSRVRVDT